jgi:hypothetical protein
MANRRSNRGSTPAVTPVSDASKDGVTMSASLTTKKGKTRGRNPREIEYQGFDLEKPDTLPKSLEEFMNVSGVKEDKEILDYLIDGFNAAKYSEASDEIGEFINDAWDKDTQSQFRLAVRNFSKIAGKTIEESVDLLKPSIDAAWTAKQEAAKKAEAEKTPVTA